MKPPLQDQNVLQNRPHPNPLPKGEGTKSIPCHPANPCNLPRYRVKITHYIIVGHAKNPKALRLKNLGSCGIFFRLVLVTHSIDFNDQLGAVAVEVNHILSNRMLTPKFQPANLAVAQGQPEKLFRRSAIAAKVLARAIMCLEAYPFFAMIRPHPNPPPKGEGTRKHPHPNPLPPC